MCVALFCLDCFDRFRFRNVRERKRERSAVLSSSSDLVDLFTVYSHTHKRESRCMRRRGRGVILPFVSDTLVLGPLC